MQGVKQPPRNGLADNRPGENYRQLKTENPNIIWFILLCQTPQQKRTYIGQLRNRGKHYAKPVFQNQHVALKEKIPGIASLDWGTNVSPEKHDKGFTHCFVLSFASEKDRDAYLPHPAHKAFGKMLGPILDDVMVIDFWSQGDGKN